MSARGSGLLAPLRRAEPDEELLRAAAGGSERAFAALYERHRQGLYRTAMAVTMDADEALEALRQAALDGLQALRRDGAPDAATGWLHRVTRNAAIDLVGARRPPASGSESFSPRSATVLDAVVEPDHLRLLVADVETLSEEQRTALVLRELQGLGYDEIAGAMATTPAAVRQSVHQARIALGDRSAGRERACDAVRGALEAGDRRGLRGRRIRAHLARCPPCATFANGLRDRRAALGIMFPLLPAGADASVLANAGVAGSEGQAAAPPATMAPEEEAPAAARGARGEAVTSRAAWKGLTAGGLAAVAAVAGALAVGMSDSATEAPDDAVTRNTAPPAAGRPGLPPPASGRAGEADGLLGDGESPLSGALFAAADRGDRPSRGGGLGLDLGPSPDGSRFASGPGPSGRSGPSGGSGPSSPSGGGAPSPRPKAPSGGGAPSPRPKAPSGGGAPPSRPKAPSGGGAPPSRPKAPSGGGAPPSGPSGPSGGGAPPQATAPPKPPSSPPPPSGGCGGPVSELACAADELTDDALRIAPKIKPLTDPLGL